MMKLNNRIHFYRFFAVSTSILFKSLNDDASIDVKNCRCQVLLSNFELIQAEMKFAVEFLAHDAKHLVKT